MKARSSLVDHRVDTKFILMAAWTAIMCLYIYCDIYSLYRPGQLGHMLDGKMGPFDVTQAGLFLAGLLMVVPSLMILLSVLAPARAGRVANLVAGVLYFLVNVGNLFGEGWAYYFLFGLIELGLAVFIFVVALRWPRQGA